MTAYFTTFNVILFAYKKLVKTVNSVTFVTDGHGCRAYKINTIKIKPTTLRSIHLNTTERKFASLYIGSSYILYIKRKMNMRARCSLEKHNLYCYVDYRAVPFVLSRIIRGIRLASVDPAARDRREPYTNTYTRYNI